MSKVAAFLPTRDLYDLRRLDLSSPQCFDHVRNNLEDLALLLGAVDGEILYSSPQRLHEDVADAAQFSDDQYSDIEVDPFERQYVTRWLTRLTSELSMHMPHEAASEQQAEDVEYMSQRATELLATCAGKMAAGPSVKLHTFEYNQCEIRVKLRDASLVHDSLGTHTWGAAPILSQLVLPLPYPSRSKLKILELGAGTGLVGLAASLWSEQHRTNDITEIYCTDYHPHVLDNLAYNVELNGWDRTGKKGGTAVQLQVRTLDWQAVHQLHSKDGTVASQILTSQTVPEERGRRTDVEWSHTLDPDMKEQFDMIIAADCIYDPVHPTWIRSVAEHFLCLPSPDRPAASLLHVMVPLRPTHREEVDAMYDAFKATPKDGRHLIILSEQDYIGHENFGVWSRGADQSRQRGQHPDGMARVYRWFQIGWDPSGGVRSSRT